MVKCRNIGHHQPPNRMILFSLEPLKTETSASSYFFIRWLTACSRPSMVSSNMGKIFWMVRMVRV